MTAQEIKDIINNAVTVEDLGPLYVYHDAIKSKEAKISRILKAKENQIKSLDEIGKLQDMTI